MFDTQQILCEVPHEECDLLKIHAEKNKLISALTQIAGFHPDVPNLLQNFSTDLTYCVGRNDTNQNVHSVVASRRFIVELIIL